MSAVQPVFGNSLFAWETWFVEMKNVIPPGFVFIVFILLFMNFLKSKTNDSLSCVIYCPGG